MRLVSLAACAAALTLAPIAGAAAREGVRVVPGTSGPVATTTRPAPAEPPPAATSVPSPAVAATAQPTDRGALTVTVNRAKVIRLPERAQTVIVGNPAIADLSLQKNGIVVVTGKSYGATNLIALDASGTMLAESLVHVIAQTDNLVVVQRAFERFSYACSPTCQPSVNLGDNGTYFNDTRAQADAHNQFAVSR